MTSAARLRVAIVAVACAGGIGPAAGAESAQPTAQPDATVWSTRGRCNTPRRVRLTLTYHDKTVYRGVLALCQGHTSELPLSEPRVTRFSFFGAPRDLAPATATERSQAIDGRLWEASAGADAVVVGLSFSTASGILLNVTHPVSPDAASSHVLSPALRIDTAPPEPPR